jgi:hypothetical protein
MHPGRSKVRFGTHPGYLSKGADARIGSQIAETNPQVSKHGGDRTNERKVPVNAAESFGLVEASPSLDRDGKTRTARISSAGVPSSYVQVKQVEFGEADAPNWERHPRICVRVALDIQETA